MWWKTSSAEDDKKELESMIRFGKSVNLAEDKAGCMYAGRSLRQLPGGGFGVHMEEYIYKRLSMAKIQCKVLKKFAATAELWEEEKTQMRGILASLGWLSCEGRPDVASAASILAGAFPTPMMDHLFEANEVVKHLKVTPVELKIWPIPEEKLRLVLLSDAAFDSSGKEKLQHGRIIGCTDNTLNQGEEAPFSWIQWRSRRLRRKASSSTLCEALSVSAATAALEKQQALLESMRFADFHTNEKRLGGHGTARAIHSHCQRQPQVCRIGVHPHHGLQEFVRRLEQRDDVW